MHIFPAFENLCTVPLKPEPGHPLPPADECVHTQCIILEFFGTFRVTRPDPHDPQSCGFHWFLPRGPPTASILPKAGEWR